MIRVESSGLNAEISVWSLYSPCDVKVGPFICHQVPQEGSVLPHTMLHVHLFLLNGQTHFMIEHSEYKEAGGVTIPVKTLLTLLAASYITRCF